MSIWRKLHKNWRRKSAALKNPKKSVLTSLEQRFQKAFFLIFPEGYLCKVHPGRGMIETHKDTHTYRHTHRRNDRPLFLVSIFSPSVTDYKQEHQGVNNIFSHFMSYIRYFRYFNGWIRNERTGYGHLSYQRLEINQNRYFVLHFSHILALTVFLLFLGRHIG